MQYPEKIPYAQSLGSVTVAIKDSGRGAESEDAHAVAEIEILDTPESRFRHTDASFEQWERWTVDRNSAAREVLINAYAEYAKTIAAMTYARRTHNEIDFEDYSQLALVGLIESVDRFDPAFGVLFRTFAARRIQGSILNGLVKLTEKNQQIAVRRRLKKDRIESLKSPADTDAADAVAAHPKRSQDELFRYLAEVGVGVALGILLDGSGMVDAEAFGTDSHMVSPEVGYFRRSELDELRSTLKGSVSLLTKQQQQVVRCHYLQEIPFEEIARMMGVTRGRISQIHKQALLRLREVLATDTRCSVSL